MEPQTCFNLPGRLDAAALPGCHARLYLSQHMQQHLQAILTKYVFTAHTQSKLPLTRGGQQ